VFPKDIPFLISIHVVSLAYEECWLQTPSICCLEDLDEETVDGVVQAVGDLPLASITRLVEETEVVEGLASTRVQSNLHTVHRPEHLTGGGRIDSDRRGSDTAEHRVGIGNSLDPLAW